MVYKNRRRYYRKKAPKTKSFTSKALSVAGKAATALMLAKRIRDMVNIEYKIVELAAGVSPDWNGNYSVLNTVVQGVTDTTRIGDSIKCQNYNMRMNLIRGAADCITRVIFFWDAQNKTSSAADILSYVGSGQSTQSPKVYDKRFQTKWLYDKSFILTSNSPIKKANIKLPLNLHTQFDNTSTTVNTGKLVMLVISNVGANLPAVNFVGRLSFTDN